MRAVLLNEPDRMKENPTSFTHSSTSQTPYPQVTAAVHTFTRSFAYTYRLREDDNV